MLFALAAPMLAVPSTAEAQNATGAPEITDVGVTGGHGKNLHPRWATDIDGDTLSSLKIVTLPALGTLTLSGTEIMVSELPKTVTAADLSDGNLKYSPPLNWRPDIPG